MVFILPIRDRCTTRWWRIKHRDPAPSRVCPIWDTIRVPYAHLHGPPHSVSSSALPIRNVFQSVYSSFSIASGLRGGLSAVHRDGSARGLCSRAYTAARPHRDDDRRTAGDAAGKRSHYSCPRAPGCKSASARRPSRCALPPGLRCQKSFRSRAVLEQESDSPSDCLPRPSSSDLHLTIDLTQPIFTSHCLKRQRDRALATQAGVSGVASQARNGITHQLNVVKDRKRHYGCDALGPEPEGA